MDRYDPATYQGGVLSFITPAPRSSNRGWIGWRSGGEIVVQFWLKPGEQAVTLENGRSGRWRRYRAAEEVL